MKLSIKGQGHSLTLVKGHSDFQVKCLTFGLYTQVSNSGPHDPLVVLMPYFTQGDNFCDFLFASPDDGALLQMVILKEKLCF